MSSLAVPEALVTVALDFGTTFSGFAWAENDQPDKIYTFYEWPGTSEGGGRPYCKAPTALFYPPLPDPSRGMARTKQVYEPQSWGWPAVTSFDVAAREATKAKRQSAIETTQSSANEHGYYIAKFKLHLAGPENIHSSKLGITSAQPLPPHLSLEKAITDYLRKISEFILDHIRLKRPTLTNDEVQWCLTVPAIWDDSAKRRMRKCAEKAGLVAGCSTPKNIVGSPNPLEIVLEPEAASLYCWATAKNLHLVKGDQFLVADIGGGTTDIVVQEKVTDGVELNVKEVVACSGCLCGGSYVDQNFFEHVCRRIGCFGEFVKKNVSTLVAFQNKWQLYKTSFDGKNRRASMDLDISLKLSKEWQKFDEDNGIESDAGDYESLELSYTDLKEIFDPVVQQIIETISHSVTPTIKALMVVGGFSCSPYLMNRIKQAFELRVGTVINPPEPGKAICHGAVLMSFKSEDAIVSRISRKTYGVEVHSPFDFVRHPLHRLVYVDGRPVCDSIFWTYIRKGLEVKVDECVAKTVCGYRDYLTVIPIYSSSTVVDPRYVDEEGVLHEGEIVIDCGGSELPPDLEPGLEVSMYFGRSSIEVRVRRLNFGDTAKIEIVTLDFAHD